MNTKVTKELIERQMGAKGFSSNAAPLKRLTDPLQDTPMVVTLDQLRSYEHNPRKTRNPLYDEIKASIKARGLDQPPLLHAVQMKIITSSETVVTLDLRS